MFVYIEYHWQDMQETGNSSCLLVGVKLNGWGPVKWEGHSFHPPLGPCGCDALCMSHLFT